MTPQPSGPPRVPSVPPGAPRPRWSVMVPTYNCAGYLGDALLSVLEQDPGPEIMQIEVVDDASADDPERVVAEVGGGRVAFHRQPANLGNVGNFNTCLERARGQLVHILHGDDAVRDGFYAALEHAFERPEVGAAFTRSITMDEHGNWLGMTSLRAHTTGVLDGWLERIAVKQLIAAPSIAVRRDVYEELGGFDARIGPFGEDWEMWTRIAARFAVWYDPEPLALYRRHERSITARTLAESRDLRGLQTVIELNRAVLPADREHAITSRACTAAAGMWVGRARTLLGAGEPMASLRALAQAVRLSRSPLVLAGALRVLAAMPAGLRRA